MSCFLLGKKIVINFFKMKNNNNSRLLLNLRNRHLQIEYKFKYGAADDVFNTKSQITVLADAFTGLMVKH